MCVLVGGWVFVGMCVLGAANKMTDDFCVCMLIISYLLILVAPLSLGP